MEGQGTPNNKTILKIKDQVREPMFPYYKTYCEGTMSQNNVAEEILLQRSYTDDQQVHEKVLSVPVVREMLIKTTATHRLVHLKWTIMEKT